MFPFRIVMTIVWLAAPEPTLADPPGRVVWDHRSSVTGALPKPDVGRQVASLIVDIDGDGRLDLVGGGYWFKHAGALKFQAHAIDAEYRFTRTAAGDLIQGGRPEVLIGSGDGVGPLNLYQWQEGAWARRTLIERVDHGHTLQVADIDGDGHLDIYTAEMHTPGPGGLCRQWILFGDGKGGFVQELLSTGAGSHESKLGDLNRDGRIDILQKDFQHRQRLDVWLNRGAPQ